MKRFIGDKAFYRNLFIVALPIVIQQLITSSVQLVDNVMVGQLGKLAIGSVSVVNQLYFVVILVTFGAMGGAGVLTAQYFGAKDHDKLKQTFRFKILIGLSVAFISFFLFTFFGKSLISLFTTNSQTIEFGLGYMNIIKWSMFPWAISISISNTFRETGITKPLLYISLVAIITNTILNYFLIFGSFGVPKLGVEGAGIATLISRFVEFGLMFILLLKKGEIFRTKVKNVFHIDKSILLTIVIMAIPLTLNEALWSTGQTVFLQAYSTRGDDALAAMNIANAISQLVFVAFGGIGTGVAVLVGNTLGKNDLRLAKDNAEKLIFFALMFAVFTGILLFIFSFFVLDLYNVSEEIDKIAVFVIRTNAIFIPVYSFNVAMYFTLRAGGDTRSTLMMDAGYIWVVSVPIALILSRMTNLPVTMLFLIIQILDIPKMVFALSRYRKEHWMKNLALSE
ncbi:MAG: MATE family efflux transporter [Candidatus Izemoplasmatales bacterium]|nr:MATE family efflux transporter [Candidatus Izemoplasmatales bacterium]